MNCPFCNAWVQPGSDMCPQCRASLSSGSGGDYNPYSPPMSGGGSYDSGQAPNISTLSQWQKILSYTICALVILFFIGVLMMVVGAVVGGIIGAQMGAEAQAQGEELDHFEMQRRISESPVMKIAQPISTITSGLYLLCSLFAVVPVVMTSTSAKYNIGLTIVYSLTTLLCFCFNLIPLIILNIQAAGTLKASGARVGWFGAY